MKSFKKILQNALKNKIPENKLRFLPNGFQKIGDIVIVNIKPEIDEYSGEIGKCILENLKNIKTVCKKTGKVSSIFRKPDIGVMCGDGTETIHLENNCFYKIDVTKIMFSKGNVLERGRIAKLVESDETVTDMFAGIGYFSLPIAKNNPTCKIYAIDINPVAIKFLKENCKLNKTGNIETINSDCRTVSVRLKDTADRIVMGYLPKTYESLPYAFRILKSKGIIHYHDTFAKNELWQKPINILKKHASASGYKLERVLYKNIVKEYAPNVYHVVIDGKFKSNK